MKRLLVLLVMLVAISANAQWQPDVRLTNNTSGSYTSLNNSWCVASSGTAVHVVWFDYRDGNPAIYYKRSTDAGVNWGIDTRLTNNTGNSVNPSIAVSGSFVNVVWQDARDGNQEIYFKRSTDAGITWGADIRLTKNNSLSENPSIAVSGPVVNVVWRDERDGNREIYYKHSTNAGTSWGMETRLTNNTAESSLPSVALSGSVVYVVWVDRRDVQEQIYFKRSTDAGVNWGADTRLTNNNAGSYNPSVAVSGSAVHIVWFDIRDYNREIYYKRSIDGGASWEADVRLTNDTAFSFYPSVALSGSTVHVLWIDTREGNYEVYYKHSIDAGISWGADTRLTNNTAHSAWTSVSVSGSAVNVVWEDNRDGNYEIYYKRNPTGNPLGIQNISTEILSSYSLGQNYPNPFNPITVIRFNITGFPVGTSGNDKMVLKVYDVQGREVQTLVNERLNAGTYEVKFDGSGLTSGVYFYKMVTEGFTETKRMLLIK
ncbi:MAG: T9SS type A sorting domain-containing protein [Ignavibacteria bacterium]